MINDLIDTDKGRKVLYRGWDGSFEEGVIASWTDAYVFVRFGNSVRPQACGRDQLEFIFGEEPTNGQ